MTDLRGSALGFVETIGKTAATLAADTMVKSANVTLVTLPPYSPELNPVERLWLYLRQHHWFNRTYADLEALEAAAVAGWRAVCLKPDKVQTICRCEYAGG